MPTLQRLTPATTSADDTSADPRPHVLLVLDGFPKALGGGERIVLRMAELLPQYGSRVSILTLALHPDSALRLDEVHCPLYLLPLTNAYGLDALRGAFALRRFLREQKVSVVQTFFESSDLWAGLVTRLGSGAKLIWSRRDMGILRGPKHRLAYRVLRRLPHAVAAVSERVAQHVREVDGVAPQRVHVVHNGLDLEALATVPDTAPKTPRCVTTIGNVRPVKGHDVFVRAAAQVAAQFPDVVFTVAGEILDQPYYQELQGLLEALALTDRFHFLGRITDLRQHLASASLFVLPSRSEGFSNALIEAMAAGVPSIATDVGGNAEAIRDGHSGRIVPSEDVNALATAMMSVLGDNSLADSYRIEGQKAVAEHFTSAAMMRKNVVLYDLLLGRNHT